MSGRHSKQKGNNFERALSKMLSEAFKNEFEVEQSFRRSVTSGSFFGGKNASRGAKILNEHKFDVSDIIVPEKFLYNIEAKHYKEAPSFNALITQNCKQWDKWIEQIERDTKISDKRPMLVVKYDNIKPMCFIKENIDNFYFAKYKNYYIYYFEDILKSDIRLKLIQK